jgi:hypothetical protein
MLGLMSKNSKNNNNQPSEKPLESKPEVPQGYQVLGEPVSIEIPEGQQLLKE